MEFLLYLAVRKRRRGNRYFEIPIIIGDHREIP